MRSRTVMIAHVTAQAKSTREEDSPSIAGDCCTRRRRRRLETTCRVGNLSLRHALGRTNPYYYGVAV